MTTWLLDAGVWLRAHEAEQLITLARAPASLALAREVYREVAQPESTKEQTLRRAAELKRVLDTRPEVRVLDLPLLTPAALRYAELRQGRTTANDAGEAASVALASFDDALVFVTTDRDAAWLGLREMGGRVCGLAWFLRSLVEAGAMDMRAASAVLEKDRTPAPSWWAAWVLARGA